MFLNNQHLINIKGGKMSDFRENSIGWHVQKILNKNNNQPMHWQEILKTLSKKKNLQGSTPGATLLSVLIRHKNTFEKPKRGWYKLK